MKKLTLLACVVLTGTAFTSPAFAVPVSSSETELTLGFRIDDATGQGASSNLEVDLGSVSNFTTTAVLNLTGSTALNPLDLISTYGANFASRGDLAFSIGGVTSANNGFNQFYVTSAGTPGNYTPSTLTTPAGDLAQLQQTLGGFSATPNSTESAVLGTNASPASGIAGSYSFFSPGGGASQFGFFQGSPTYSTETLVVPGTTTLGLYSYNGQATGRGVVPTLIGTFDLTGAGTLTFTGSAVAAPEPSTYAMMAGAMGLLLLAIRRRRSLVD